MFQISFPRINIFAHTLHTHTPNTQIPGLVAWELKNVVSKFLNIIQTHCRSTTVLTQSNILCQKIMFQEMKRNVDILQHWPHNIPTLYSKSSGSLACFIFVSYTQPAVFLSFPNFYVIIIFQITDFLITQSLFACNWFFYHKICDSRSTFSENSSLLVCDVGSGNWLLMF